ncbi:hypothetical protein MOBT1_000911 [Malassezia obtusa]|uniref:Uncharacterized protein n=1 Tax=Malassezia obtusa TaxID=76774 RepID=A0AAF0DZG3_9BASI|nr:hypothetical protein MOBT1_000911 [Malassezia obtusa]
MERRREQRSVSRSDGSCTTPELHVGTPSQIDDESVCTTVTTPTPGLLGPDYEGEPGFAGAPLSRTSDDWDLFVQNMLFGYHAQLGASGKELHALPSAADQLPWPSGELVLPTPAPAPTPALGPAAPKRTAGESTRARRPKQARARRAETSFPSYTPAGLLSMDPRPLGDGAGGAESLRTWLLERRALLHKLRDDVTKDMARLDEDQASIAQLRTRLAERIDHLRRTLLTTADAPPTWDMDTLLEQDILCL